MAEVIFKDLFELGVPVVEKILRPVLVYVFLVIGLRLAGKRELAQLNPFDLIVLLTLSNTVQNAIIGNDNSLLGGMIGATTLLVVNYLTVRFLYSHKWIDRIVEGAPDVLIENGEVRQDRLALELLTEAELEMAAHKQGFASLDEVDRATLEPGGIISFVAKKPLPDESRHRELVMLLEQMRQEIALLRSAANSPDANPP